DFGVFGAAAALLPAGEAAPDGAEAPLGPVTAGVPADAAAGVSGVPEGVASGADGAPLAGTSLLAAGAPAAGFVEPPSLEQPASVRAAALPTANSARAVRAGLRKVNTTPPLVDLRVVVIGLCARTLGGGARGGVQGAAHPVVQVEEAVRDSEFGKLATDVE